MDPNNNIEDDAERTAMLRRQQMRIEHRRGPLADVEGPPRSEADRLLLEREEQIDRNRDLSRSLIMVGAFLLIYAGVWLIYAQYDVREGRHFALGLMIVSALIGMALVLLGIITRHRQPTMRLDTRRPRKKSSRLRSPL
jgi:hypothetical protein